MKRIFIISLLPAMFSCNNGKTVPSENPVVMSVDSFKNELLELSSDEFQGRKPFTAGEEKTVNYIKNKFASLGLEPGNGESYFQDVPMSNIKATADSVMNIESPYGKIKLKAPQDYIVWTDRTETKQTLDKTEFVFAGYGVVAPEYHWNDYAGINVKGKVVLVMVNDPGFQYGDNSIFKGKTMTYYGRWMYKYEEAARHGAKGCLIIHQSEAAGYPFKVVQGNFNTSRMQLDYRGKEKPNCDMIGWITDSAAVKIINAAGFNGVELMKTAGTRDFSAIPLPITASTSMKVQVEYNSTKNVIGKITGSKYPDETIIYTAHWDHLGIGVPDEKGDSIYNGAFDNATGVVGLFEIARAFKNAATPPERTIVFLSVTAEEQGLWGSAYYADHPLFSLEKTVANINMDGVNYLGITKDVISVGKGLSELEDLLAIEAKKQNRYLADEDHPESGYYYRSDHFNFAKKGVPSLHFDDGVDMEGYTKVEVGKLKDEYRLKHYHRPSDEYNTSWKLEGAILDLELYFKLGTTLANCRTWPKWKIGAEFKRTREKSDAARL